MRLIAMGGEALMEGFALLGFETFANPSADDLDRVLSELSRDDAKALLFLENSLAGEGGPSLDKVRREGGRIVVVEVPSLNAPEDYRPAVEDLVIRLLGPAALEERW